MVMLWSCYGAAWCREAAEYGYLQAAVRGGARGGREEEAGLERGDSDKKEKQETKTNMRLLLAETRSMYWQSAWSRSRSKLGGGRGLG